jgi:hypothetical protein
MAKQPELGDIVEVHCEKCRLNLDASVAAVIEGEIKQVQCRTCSNFVAYKAPVPEAVKKERAFKRVLSMRDRKSGRRGSSMPAVTRRGGGRPPTMSGGGSAAPPMPPAGAGAPGTPVMMAPRVDPEHVKRWRELTDEVDSRNALPYTRQRVFQEGEFLLHKAHGMGFVEAVEGDEITVFFRESTETLAINQESDD